jgi:hypothetical protein
MRLIKIRIGGKKMRSYIILFVVILALISCGRSDAVRPDISSPALNREAMAFQAAIELFNGGVSDPAVDADIGEILNGPGTGLLVGTPWEDDDERNWAVAVALQRDSYGYCTIPYSFLTEDPIPSVTPGVPLDLEIETIRLPKVAACYFPDADPAFIEVSIIFQFWDETSGDWEIGLVRMRFSPTNFPEMPLPYSMETIPDEDYADIQPDLAYDPNTGDLYVVSTIDYNNGDADLYFTWGVRSTYDPTEVEWEESYIAQDPSDESLNSFSARIDIGEVGFGDYEEQWMVAFVYTGWNSTIGWQVRLNYWSLDETYDPENYTPNDFGWDDPLFHDFPAGMPAIDIGPPGSNHGAIVWNQAKSDEWSNSTVMYADTHDNYISYTRLHPDETWGAECSALPAVAVHEYAGSGDYESSVSFLFCNDYVTGIWHAAAVLFTTEEEASGVEIGHTQLIHMPSPCLGKWDSGAVVEHNYGVSTALTVYDNNYWMLWSGFNPDPDAWVGGPTSVWAAWGNTD